MSAGTDTTDTVRARSAEPRPHTFHVGDEVRGNNLAAVYHITIPGYEAHVIDVPDEYRIVIEGRDGRRESVEGFRFDLVKKSEKRTIREHSYVVSMLSTIYVKNTFKTNMMKLRGESIILKRDRDNSYIGTNYRGVIVDIILDHEHPTDIERAQFVLHLDKVSNNYEALYWQFEVDRDITLPSKAIYGHISDMINEARPNEVRKEENKIKEYSGAISDYEQRLEDTKNMLKESEALLISLKKNLSGYNADSILNEFTMLKKHAHIEKTYVSVDGNIIVLTKMLRAVDGKKGRERRNNIGRFVFRIKYSPSGRTEIRAANRDFACGSREHPNISTDDNSICWGENSAEVSRMVKTGNLYTLVDFMITFFSLFPHQSGRPFMDHMQWLREKQPISNNKFIEEEL